MKRAVFWSAVSLLFWSAVLAVQEDPVEIAFNYLDRANYAQAVEYFEKALADNPKLKDIRVFQAFAWSRLGQYEKANESLRKEVELAPNSLEAPILLGFILFEQGRAGDAEALLRSYLGKNESELSRHARRSRADFSSAHPNFGLPNFILGLIEKGKGRIPEAVENFRKAQEVGYDPLVCRLYVLEGECRLENWTKALKSATELLELKSPISAQARIFQSMALERLGFEKEALACLQQAAALKRFEPWALKNLAIFHFNRGEFEESLPLLRKARRLAPQDFQAQFLLEQAESRRRVIDVEQRIPQSLEFMGEFTPEYRHYFKHNVKNVAREVNDHALRLIQTGSLSDAAGVLHDFLELYDLSPTMNYNLAQLYNSTGLWRLALRYALRAIELQNDYRDAYDLVGNISFKAAEYQDSIWFYQQAVLLAPEDALGRYNLACAYSGLGEEDLAEKNWLLAIQQEKAKPLAGETRKSEPSGALKVFVRVRPEPVSYDSYFSLGMLYSKQGKKETALQEFAQASALMPQKPEPYFETGKILLEFGRLIEAQSYFDKYISLGGDEAKVRAAVKRYRIFTIAQNLGT
jgi:tetratricopeptide (TPR) repeat protein